MARLEPLNDRRVREFLRLTRIGRLATSDRGGTPHNIPLCFWFDEDYHFYFVIDQKPKRLTARGLKRMRNIAENPQVALLIDHYEEQWGALAYVLVHGEAAQVGDADEYMLALRNLRDKYPQYRTMMLAFENNPMVRISAARVHVWGERFAAHTTAGA
jgi:PPOX class probable F420-dependent enzyme